MIKIFAIIVLAVSLFGCTRSWDGPAEVTLKSGALVKCPFGLGFDTPGVWCYTTDNHAIKIPWSAVQGYATK